MANLDGKNLVDTKQTGAVRARGSNDAVDTKMVAAPAGDSNSGGKHQRDAKKIAAAQGRRSKSHGDTKPAFAPAAKELKSGGKGGADANHAIAVRARGSNCTRDTNPIAAPTGDSNSGGKATCDAKKQAAAQGRRGNPDANSKRVPAAKPNGGALAAAAGDEGGIAKIDVNEKDASLVVSIRQLDRRRLHQRRAKNRARQASQAMAATYLRDIGVVPEDATKEAAFKEAKRQKEALLDGEVHDLGDIAEDMLLDEEIAVRYAAREVAYEKAAKKMVRQLPVWTEHFANVKGVGENGVAIMIGECGDPSERPNAAKYRKRAGICPKEEYKKSERTGGYMRPNRRKARILWEVVDSMIRQGPYAEFYQDRRQYIAMAHPELAVEKDDGKLHLNKFGDNKARFKVASRFVCDFWAAWMKTAQ